MALSASPIPCTRSARHFQLRRHPPTLDPKTTFSVGRIGGGTSVNAIPADAWMEVDMRSADQEALRALESRFTCGRCCGAYCGNAAGIREGRISVPRRSSARVRLERFPRRPRSFRRLRRYKALGAEVELSEGSTDANIP